MKVTLAVIVAALCLNAAAESAPTENGASDDAIVAAAEKMMKEDAEAKTEKEAKTALAARETAQVQPGSLTDTIAAPAETKPSIAGEAAAKQESEIPVTLIPEKQHKSEGSLVWRLIASLAIVTVMSVGAVFAGRHWTRKRNSGGDKVRIEVLHQYFMGPRRSLVLVRVAGEAILLGCTDHAINLIKPITLIDGELEQKLGKDFNHFLEDDFSIEEVQSALRGRV